MSSRVEPWGRTVDACRNRQRCDLPCARTRFSTSIRIRPRIRIDAQCVVATWRSGLGCSAAIGVSVIDAVDKALGIARSRRVSSGEKRFGGNASSHGSPSGIDNTAAALGGLFRFEAPRTVEELKSTRSHSPRGDAQWSKLEYGRHGGPGVALHEEWKTHGRGWLDRVALHGRASGNVRFEAATSKRWVRCSIETNGSCARSG